VQLQLFVLEAELEQPEPALHQDLESNHPLNYLLLPSEQAVSDLVQQLSLEL
jgi:hypothetical protein